ncbi:MAG: polysaccharide pyruvyl transferase family protein [Lyngbya sp.]|nr:polysaccharide pyruvyl transferase family protein [Lyngbya sp.]
MKIGILTFHHTTNFGATLQTYALSEALKRHNHEIEIIDYRPIKAIKHYRKKVAKPLKTNSRKILIKNFLNYSYSNLIKYVKMRNFLKSYLKLSPDLITEKDNLRKLANRYDAIVCGSDQVWCINSIRGFDSSYFLDFVENDINCLKVSYAASCGHTKTLGQHSKLISQYLDDFDAISVRDTNSLLLLKEICKKDIYPVLDPTFLIDFKEICYSKKIFHKNYLLLYIEEDLKQKEIDFINKIARERNLTIISVGEPCKIAEKNFIGISPIEWVNFFKQASYIVTNFYHGTIFSIKFNQPFTTLVRSGKVNKTGDLLQRLNLESRFVKNIDFSTVQEQRSEINYADVRNKLEVEIEKSKAYLFNIALRENCLLENQK